MNSSDRDTDEASSKQKITWYTQHFYGRVVERSRSQRLATEGHWNGDLIIVKCCQITVRNTKKTCYWDIIIPTDTNVH